MAFICRFLFHFATRRISLICWMVILQHQGTRQGFSRNQGRRSWVPAQMLAHHWGIQSTLDHG